VITAGRIVNALINWFDENDEGPHAGSLFEDTDLTWNDALLYAARHDPSIAEAHRAADPHCTCNDCIAFHFEGAK